jgi:type VII secretion-associated serine protease mycosin
MSMFNTAGIAAAGQVQEQWHLKFLATTEAWAASRGEGVLVAVVDTGSSPHPDLRSNLLPGIDIVTGGRESGFGDEDGHGTKMAGLIAAHGQAGSGGAFGIAPESKVLAVRISKSRLGGDPDDVARGIDWSVANGADVVNVSSGGSSSPSLRAAVDKAIQSDVVVVAAAGNRPADFLVGFPAAQDGVIAVGATDRNGNHADVSVTGSQIDIVAPGVDIHGPTIRGRYSGGTGTSNSAAIVAGAAALVRSKFPELSAPEVAHRLTYTAVDKGPPGRDDEYGHGVLDLVAALTADVPPLGATTTPGAIPPSTPTDSAQPKEETSGSVRSLLVSLVGVSLAVGLLVLGYRRHRRRNPL